MDKRPEQIFFQRENAEGQQAHEKMLTIANLQGNSNQTTMSCHLTPVKWLSLKKKNKNNKIINIIKDMKKREP